MTCFEGEIIFFFSTKQLSREFQLGKVNLNLTTFGEKRKKKKNRREFPNINGGISIFLIRRKTIVEW